MTIQPITPRTLAAIPGWFATHDHLLFEWFLERQDRLGQHGGLLELGCDNGKSAIVIGKYVRPGETFTIVELFGQPSRDEADVAENSGSRDTLTRAEFEANYLRFHRELPTLHTALSSTVVDLADPGSMRFIHIDGSHLYEHVVADIESARRLAGPESIVILDSYRGEQTPGAAAAAWEAVATKGLNLVALSPTKMYATFGDPEPTQSDLLRHLAEPGGGQFEVEMIGGRAVVRVNARSLPGTAAASPAAALSVQPNPTPRLRRRVRRLEEELRDLEGSQSYRLGRMLTWPVRRYRDYLDRRRENRLAKRYAGWRRSPIRKGTVFYESFFGNGVLDNPEALFRHLLEQPDLAHLVHIWAINDADSNQIALDEFRSHPRVRFVVGRSEDYHEALATSQYLISNSTFPAQFAKRPGQTYLNTWHGVPLKHMGRDMPDGAIESNNILRNFVQADYLVSANPFMTDVMYRRAYLLQGIFRGAVIEEGQPRTDRQHAAANDPSVALEELRRHGIDAAGQRIVVWAPTWRGERFERAEVDIDTVLDTVRALRSAAPDDVVVLMKAHQVVFDAVSQQIGAASFLVPNSVPTNLLLGVTDVLITDYSSIFFDYLASGRPLIHYTPDIDEYEGTRGLYLPPHEWYGPITRTPNELVRAVAAALEGAASPRLPEGASRFNPYDDGSVCDRITDIIFRGKDEADYRVLRDFGTSRTTILMYLGGMQSNGITKSALNFLHHLDYDKYDLTVYWTIGRGRDVARNARQIDRRVRVLPRANMFNGTPKEVKAQQYRLVNTGLRGEPGDEFDPHHVEFWSAEYRRCFGDAQFDHVIDFSGYGSLSPFIFTCAAGAPRRSIWLHSDMASDQQRETIGERHLEDRLGAVFSTYRTFDRLVSVSPTLCELNRTHLADYASPEKFVSVPNTIDGSQVLELAQLNPATDPDSVSQLDLEVNKRTDRYFGDDVVTFITVGRLSPEKNHARLIDAFAQVHADDKRTRLVILGAGKLSDEIADLIAARGLNGTAIAPGKVDNPFRFVRRADCFVLSSDYEGQPMVILEARVLGLPVITTQFTSVGDSVPPDSGIVVPRSVEGVEHGMREFLAGRVPAHALDYDAYNAAAMAQFDRAIND